MNFKDHMVARVKSIHTQQAKLKSLQKVFDRDLQDAIIHKGGWMSDSIRYTVDATKCKDYHLRMLDHLGEAERSTKNGGKIFVWMLPEDVTVVYAKYKKTVCSIRIHKRGINS